MNFRKSSKRPLTPPLIFGKSYCRFFKKLYSLKNHICGIFLKSPGYESIKNNDPCCQIQSLNFKFWGWLGPRLLVHWGFLTIVNSQWGGVKGRLELFRKFIRFSVFFKFLFKLLKKTYPENTPLYHFYAKKTLFKSPKFATKIFGLEMTPPPVRNFSENSSVLVGRGFP